MKLLIKFTFLFPLLLSNCFSQNASHNFINVERIVTEAIKDSAFPGAVLLISKDRNIQFHKAFGYYTYDKNSKEVSTETIYDLASLTKVIATTTAVMLCVDKNLFSLDDYVAKYIPEFSSNNKENITIRNLLLHNSGLPAWKKFWEIYDNPKEVLNDIYGSKPEFEPSTKTVYSDLGIITLGKVIEKVTGKSLDLFCKEEIFPPLEMNNTYFNPPDSLKFKIAPTELDNYWRKRLLVGEVHDETSSLLKGVAGHAGLFSTAEDIHKLLLTLLNKGEYNGVKLIDSSTVKLFTKKASDQSSRALGWDTKSLKGSSAGSLLSNLSYGHTGFTGTSVWTDPIKKIIVIFLTNRVHPARENRKIIRIRPELHDAVVMAFQKNK
jgi:CubicO group peptidase (beta-lactamase class C family)